MREGAVNVAIFTIFSKVDGLAVTLPVTMVTQRRSGAMSATRSAKDFLWALSRGPMAALEELYVVSRSPTALCSSAISFRGEIPLDPSALINQVNAIVEALSSVDGNGPVQKSCSSI